MDRNAFFRRIPKIDNILEEEQILSFIQDYGLSYVTDCVRLEVENLRKCVREEEEESRIEQAFSSLYSRITERIEGDVKPKLRKVINATGTILHTNLGRALLSPKIGQELAKMLSSYSNLEYDLEKGERGERYSHIKDSICKITGAEDAMVVNNNASAVLLILSTLAKGGEVVVSRGELVEIGGKFRIPDVCAASGAEMREVGTTNKTHYQDYVEVVNENTKAFLKVHTSNYKICGFTESVEARELKPLSLETGVPIVEDLGSGVLLPLEKYGLPHEPTVQEAIEAGVDVVCFSGDKLLGGPQAGIIIGKKEYIDQMKKNPLTRALRVDKLTITALELCFLEYLKEEGIEERIPVLRMLSEEQSVVKRRGEALLRLFKKESIPGEYSLHPSKAQVGGGSLPDTYMDSYALVYHPEKLSVSQLEARLRKGKTPIIGRIWEDDYWMDLRTIQEEELNEIIETFQEALY